MRNFCTKILTTSLLFAASAVFGVNWQNGINVKDFGAKGDGVADDTAAIQRALDFERSMESDRLLLARQPMLAGAPELGDLPVFSSTAEAIMMPEIYFPEGTYLIRDMLIAGEYTFLRGAGSGKSTIVQTNPEKDILYWHGGYRVNVHSLGFTGGARQLVIYTNNNDMAYVSIENCRLADAETEAVWSHNYRNPEGVDYATACKSLYNVDFSGGVTKATPNDVSGLTYMNNSTLITVSNTEFINCRRIADMGSDGALFFGCTFDMASDQDGAAFILCSDTRFLNCRATAPAVGGKPRFWMDVSNYNFVIEGCSFEVDGDPGMALVHYTTTRNEIPANIIIRDSEVDCAGAPEGAVLFIDNQTAETTPYTIDITNVREISGREIAAVRWQVTPTAERLMDSCFDYAPARDLTGGSLEAEWPFRLLIADNQGVSADVPAALQESLVTTLPESLPRKAAQVAIDSTTMASNFHRVLYAVDFGVDLEPVSDDTEAMKKVLAAAGHGDAAMIVLPPVEIRLSDVLELPPSVAFTAPGLATLHQTQIDRPIFRSQETKYLWVSNLRFASGSIALDIKSQADAAAEVLVERCFFYQQLETAIEALAGNGYCGENNRAQLKLLNSIFISPIHGVVTNFAHSELLSFWVSTNARQNLSAFFRNLGGDMLVRGMLGVPMPMKDHKFNHLPVANNWPYANDIRWFDNYGDLTLEFNRFGGEYYGIPQVYNFNAEAQIIIDGGFVAFSYPGAKQCILMAVENPAQALFRNFGWGFKWPEAAACKRPAGKTEKPKIQLLNYLFEEDSFEKR